jgi:DNA-binding ferritin-like protein
MTPEIGKIAKQAFADTFLFYLQAHYYHWNVEGRKLLTGSRITR